MAGLKITRKNSKKILLFGIPFLLVLAGTGTVIALHRNAPPRVAITTPKKQQEKAPLKKEAAPAPPPVQTSHAAAQPVSSPPPQTSSTPCTNNTRSKFLLVSISAQHLWACAGSTLANESGVTTGMTQAPNGVDDATPTGIWTIDSKQTDQHLRGSDVNGSWDDFVQYWIPFDGAIGFHDASWQTFPFGDPQYQTGGSHGCVHLPTDIAAWVYNWAPVGTVVQITG